MLQTIRVEDILKSVKKLPPTPQILPKLRELLKSEHAEIEDIKALIKVDQALSAQLVRASNSPFYGSSGPCNNIDDAITRIGFNEVYKLVAFVASSYVLKGGANVYEFKPNEVFHHSVTCATIMQMMAKFKGHGGDTAYSVGLMHLIGKIAISRYCSEKKLPFKLKGECKFDNEQELELLGTDFTVVGSRLLTECLEYIEMTQDDLASCLIDAQATLHDSKDLLTAAV